MTLRITLALGAACIPSLALAHTFFVDDEATSDTPFKAVLAVPHGCEGRPTTAIGIKLPEGFIAAQPMPKPGWSVEIIKGRYARAYKVHGKPVTEGPVEIRWSGGALDDAWYDEFTVRGTFSGVVDDVAFPVTQVCADGIAIAWDEVAAAGADPHALAHPAPIIRVLSAPTTEMHADHHGGQPTSPGQASVGDLTLTGGFARAMLPNQTVGGGYITIANTGGQPDRLVAVATSLASGGEVHEMAMKGDVMTMRALPDGVEIAAGATVRLSPGGLHMMFTGVSTPFAQGGTVPVTLTFERAGAVTIDLPVLGAGAKEAGSGTALDTHSDHAMPGMAP